MKRFSLEQKKNINDRTRSGACTVLFSLVRFLATPRLEAYQEAPVLFLRSVRCSLLVSVSTVLCPLELDGKALNSMGKHPLLSIAIPSSLRLQNLSSKSCSEARAGSFRSLNGIAISASFDVCMYVYLYVCMYVCIFVCIRDAETMRAQQLQAQVSFVMQLLAAQQVGRAHTHREREREREREAIYLNSLCV